MGTSLGDRALRPTAAKVEGGERLESADGLGLYASREIHEIGRLANLVRERLHGDAAYYNVNRHINYTNYCVLRCRFCSFYRPFGTRSAAGRTEADCTGSSDAPEAHPAADREGLPDGYQLSVERIVEMAREAYAAGATEVHIVGGLHPKLPFSYYVEMCRGIREACPRLHIKAFTAVEVIHFARIARPRMTVRQVLEELRAAGLGSLPGGGAEIFDDRVHNEAYRTKVGEEGWFDVHRVAHEMGMPTNATMLYGQVERPEERIAHLLKLRQHQDESLRGRQAAFNCFVPLSFVPEGSALAHLPGPTGLDDLKTLAISRLMLDNVRHVKAFWIMHSANLAQVSLDWGVDDLDGTVVYYDITKREGEAGKRHQEMTVGHIRRLIRETGRRPVERDTLYRRVLRDGAGWTVGETV
jgi:aminodeoxyfutalosine synthase